MFKCDICGREFATKRGLNVHRQAFHNREPTYYGKHRIWPKELTAWLCGCIACDGHIRLPKDKPRDIVVVYTSDEEWLRDVCSILQSYGISYSVRLDKTPRRPPKSPKEYYKPQYRVYLTKRNPPRKLTGENQYLSFLLSIEHYGFQRLIGLKNYERLKDVVFGNIYECDRKVKEWLSKS